MQKFLIPLGVLGVVAIGSAYFFIQRPLAEFPHTPPAVPPSSGAITMIEESPAAEGFGAAGTASLPQTSPPVQELRQIQKGEKEYRSTKYGFVFFYPDTLSVKEYDEGGGGHTIAFEDAAGTFGFNMYILPYTERQVSQERFRKDEPSGVMKEPKQIVLSGSPATIFFGKNDLMGDTREVWFIKNGYLFEVNTYKALDGWLGTIMQTWRFI